MTEPKTEKTTTEPEIDILIVALKIIHANTKSVAKILFKINADRPYKDKMTDDETDQINNWLRDNVSSKEKSRKVARTMVLYIAVTCLDIPIKKTSLTESEL